MKARQNSNQKTLDGKAQAEESAKRENVIIIEDGSMDDIEKKEKMVMVQDVECSQGSRKRFIWTSELEQKFQDAVTQLNNDAVPSKIAKLMNVEGLERHHVASHLQKYRLRQMNELCQKQAYLQDGIYSDYEPIVMASSFIPNLGPNPPMQMHPYSAFPLPFSPSETTPMAYVESKQACLSNLPSGSKFQLELSQGVSTTHAQLNQRKEEATSLHDMSNIIPGTRDIGPSEFVQQPPQLDITTKTCCDGLVADAPNNDMLLENDFFIEDYSLISDFDLPNFDFTELPPFEVLVNTDQVQNLDGGQQQTSTNEVASTSQSTEDDDFAELIEKILTEDEQTNKMNDQSPPADKS